MPPWAPALDPPDERKKPMPSPPVGWVRWSKLPRHVRSMCPAFAREACLCVWRVGDKQVEDVLIPKFLAELATQLSGVACFLPPEWEVQLPEICLRWVLQGEGREGVIARARALATVLGPDPRYDRGPALERLTAFVRAHVARTVYRVDGLWCPGVA